MKVYFHRWPVFKENCSAFLKKQIRLAYANKDCAILLTEDDDVYAIGSNWEGLLGQSRNPREPRKIEGLCQKKIKSFTHGSWYDESTRLRYNEIFAALDEDGRLFTWGYNWDGRLGNSSDFNERDPTPKLVKGELAKEKVIQVAFGHRYTLALTEQGQVFFWGHTRRYENRKKGYCWIEPKRVMNNRKAFAIASTHVTAFVLLEDGQLYFWDFSGRSMDYEDDMNESDPDLLDVSLIEGLIGKTIKQIACGTDHCLALADSGQIISWGYNDYGQLGTDEEQDNPSFLHQIKLVDHKFGKVVEIAATFNVSAARFEDGTVRAWGDTITEKERWRGKSSWIECRSIDEAFAPESMCRTLDMSLVKTVAEELNLELNDQKADVCFHFQVGDQLIWAHKNVLMQSSKYFEAMFQTHWTESKKTTILVENFDNETFYAFLNYLYTGEFQSTLPLSIWNCLRDLAEYYCHDGLKDIYQIETRVSDLTEEEIEEERRWEDEWRRQIYEDYELILAEAPTWQISYF